MIRVVLVSGDKQLKWWEEKEVLTTFRRFQGSDWLELGMVGEV